MYYTQSQITNMNLVLDKVFLDTSMIQDLINKDIASKEKENMRKGVDYYNFRHDILERVKYYRRDNVAIKDEISPNNKLVHPFLKIIIDQLVDYIAGIQPNISIEDEKAQKLLKEYIDDRFYDILIDWMKNSCKKGVEWLHPYINSKKELKTVIVPAQEIIPIWDTQYQNDLTEIIRYYEYELINSKGESTTKYKVEFWTENTVTYYEQLENDLFVLDSNYSVNPCPHFIRINKQLAIEQSRSWGKVPFVPLFNNTERKTDLEPVKPLIDAYDIIQSDWLNDLQTFNELVYVIKGLSMNLDNEVNGLSELIQVVEAIKNEKVITTDNEGGVDVVKNEIPVEAKERLLDKIEQQIFYFSQAIDVSKDKFGNNPTGVSLMAQYKPLDMKANGKIRKTKVALQDYFYFLMKWFEMNGKGTYNPKDVKVVFNKSMVINEKEEIEKVNMMDISHESKLERYPNVDDVQQELDRISEERQAGLTEIERQLAQANNEPTE